MTPVEFHPDAAEEVRDAVAYYDAKRPGLGDDFRAELEAAVLRIQQGPQMYAVESGAVRLCPLHRFPFSIYYEELTDRIWIAAVGHQSRRPGYWTRRRPN
jgi:plasmid stabilization system protein ParE